MNLDEILSFLLAHFPMCVWKVVPKNGVEGDMIQWKPTEKFKVEVYPSHFAKTVHDGSEFISLDWENKKEQSGGGSPCRNYETLERRLTGIIERYDGKLFEDQQLTLF